MKKEFFQVRADNELLHALDEASRGKQFRADWTREALRIVLGCKNPDLKKRFLELMKRHPRVNWLGMVEAALESYTIEALRCGIDGNFHPVKLPREPDTLETTPSETTPPPDLPSNTRYPK